MCGLAEERNEAMYMSVQCSATLFSVVHFVNCGQFSRGHCTKVQSSVFGSAVQCSVVSAVQCILALNFLKQGLSR